jgi:hypothetical protein
MSKRCYPGNDRYDAPSVRPHEEGCALRSVRLLAPLLLITVLVVAAATAASGSARSRTAQAAGGCGVGSGRNDGYSYVTSLSVRHTSCAGGLKLVKHHGHLNGWGCKRKVLDRSPVQYDARMTCHSGGEQVVWTFTQNT